jgi:hypothetical protein
LPELHGISEEQGLVNNYPSHPRSALSIELSEDEDGESASTKKVRRESEAAVKRKGGPAKSKKK